MKEHERKTFTPVVKTKRNTVDFSSGHCTNHSTSIREGAEMEKNKDESISVISASFIRVFSSSCGYNALHVRTQNDSGLRTTKAQEQGQDLVDHRGARCRGTRALLICSVYRTDDACNATVCPNGAGLRTALRHSRHARLRTGDTSVELIPDSSASLISSAVDTFPRTPICASDQQNAKNQIKPLILPPLR